ncbi:hypothetical protein [Actinophytocola sp.]|uniref:hypothetical protein n=1 Tax=Actinophytocola sp. TaxID=1872138 RepID=UPI00389A30F7
MRTPTCARIPRPHGPADHRLSDGEYGDDVDHDIDATNNRDGLRVSDAILDRFWPAAIAYTVAMLTQQDDRPSHRSPWHVLESFELGDWIHVLDPDLDSLPGRDRPARGHPFIRDTLDPTDHDA